MERKQDKNFFPLRQVIDLFTEQSKAGVLHDVRTASKNKRPGIIRAYLTNIDQTLTESFDTGKWFTAIIDLRNQLKELQKTSRQA